MYLILSIDTPVFDISEMTRPSILIGQPIMELYDMKATYSPGEISPFTARQAPYASTVRTWSPEKRSPNVQKAEMSTISLTQMPVYFLFCSSKRLRSKSSRPNALTTLTPVRFSWAIVESTPSSSSARRNVVPILLWKSTE